ncbi:MAG: electron transfer flavoprotein subunit beta/FixA family protein [Bacteroidia bacterium]|nr:electron transfer flavoprotein subunit beta/FixA family protein [Bacteroidia bacterium]
MKILVCISNVPDTTSKITFTPDKKAFNSTGVQFIINPYDEIALTRALELKEASGNGSVTVIHVGPAANEANIRKALAIGADDAIRINAEATDGFFTAVQIATVAKDKGYDLILAGRESIDYNSGQVGPMIAELMGLPSVSVVQKLDIAGGEALMEREIDGGKEILSCKLPLVVTAQKGMAEPRIPNMRGIMTARTKPLQVVEPSGNEKFSESLAFDSPAPKQAVKLVEAGKEEELVALLHNEAKII